MFFDSTNGDQYLAVLKIDLAQAVAKTSCQQEEHGFL